MKTTYYAIILFSLAISAQAQALSENTLNKSQPNTKHLKTNTMEKQSIKVVSEFLEAVQQGNNEKLAMILHPDIQWDQPGKNKFSGLKKSAIEVFQMVGGMYELSQNTFTLSEIKVLTANGSSVACLLHFKASNPVNVLDVENIDVYEVKDGKIVSAKIFSSNIEKENDFWGK